MNQQASSEGMKQLQGAVDQITGYKAPVPATTPVVKTSTVSRSESIDKLAAALAKAQAAITFASKDATNPHFKNKYADLAAVWEAIRGPLTANGLSVVQLPSADGLKVTLTTILLHESGQSLTSDLTMMAGQNTPQAVGSTITYARRYALSSVAGVAQDDDDGNAGSGKGGK